MRPISSWLPASFSRKGLSYLYIILIVSVIFASYGLFFYLQYSIEKDTNTRLVQEQIHSQIESTKKISRHIGSDIDAITLALHGLANSAYLQQGDLSTEKVEKLMQEVYSRLNMFTVVDRLFILDRNNTATVFIVPEGQTNPYFGSDNISFEQLVNQTRVTNMPAFTEGFKGLDDVYRVAVTFPIINRQTNEYIGSLAALIPTVRFFEHYGNVHDIENQYLVSLDKTATFLTHPIKQNIGTNFFDPDFQQFIKHNRDYNNQIRRVLMLPPPTSTLSTSIGNDGQQEKIRQQQEEEKQQGQAGGQQQQQDQQKGVEKQQTQPSYAIYDYGIGERLSTGLPILAQMRPAYFIFLVTPTSDIYSQVDEVLLLERIGMFSLLAGTTVAIVLLMVFLLKWNRSLNREVKRRTRELEDSNLQLADANKKLVIRDKMQEEFVNIAAHELRTPLQPIISYSKLALKNKIDKGEAMRGIDRHVDRLHKLATDLLAVSRIEGGSLPYRMEKVRINELIVDVANSFVDTIVNAYGAGAARLNVDWNHDSRSKNDNPNIENSNAIAHDDNIAKSKEGVEAEVWVRHSSDSHQITKNISKLNTEGEQRKEDQETPKTENQEDLESTDVSGGARLEGEQAQEQEQKRQLKDFEQQQQEQQPQQRLTIDVDLDPKIKEITVDKDRISQVLSNLIDNSIKFTTNVGCCIKIHTRLVSQSVPESLKVDDDIHNNDIDNDNNSNSKLDDHEDNCNYMVNIIISDTGGGIPDDILPRLFEKFATKSIKGKGNRQGTGLGLFITKSIITAHNGAIRAFNNDIGGTTFSIVLPAR